MGSRGLLHVYKHEQVYITHMHTHSQSTSAKVHSQEAVLFLCADE